VSAFAFPISAFAFSISGAQSRQQTQKTGFTMSYLKSALADDRAKFYGEPDSIPTEIETS